MESEKIEIVKFAPKGKDSFYDAVMARVNHYFRSNNISPYGNKEMWVKTILILLLYFTPYAFIVSGLAAGSLWLFFGLWILMGIGMVGVGTAIMHDANHGSYSSSKKLNNIISHTLELVGGYTVNWRIQHNILHHTYTNISGLDEDIESVKFLRFSPRQPRYWFHKYQHIYAWGFYMLMTLYWMTVKDFTQLIRYHQNGLLIKEKVSLKKAMSRLVLYKGLSFVGLLVLPILFSGIAWYFVIAGFILMHFTAGLSLACIFQPAHVMETANFASPVQVDGKKRIEDTWAVHEVINTVNFAPRNRLLSWFIGGLNYQIEHHLFTGVCHVHYPKLAPIVRATLADYGLPYNVEPTFFKAILSHARMLRQLGRE